MNEAIYPILLLVVNVFAVGTALYLKFKYEQKGTEDGAPVGLTAIAALFFVGVHFLVTIGWAGAIDRVTIDKAGPLGPSLATQEDHNRRVALVVVVSLFIGSPATFLFAQNFVKGFSHASVDTLYGINTAREQITDFSKARTLYLRGDIDGAVRMCREYFREKPDTPRALFEAHKYLVKENRHEEAADILREIIRAFQEDDEIWARATFDLSAMYENYFDDRSTADYMLREIEKRTPNSEVGRLAHGRLARAWDKKGSADGGLIT